MLNKIKFFLLIFLLIMPIFSVIAATGAGTRINGKIVFASDRDGNYEIYVMNADGSGQTRLTTSNYDDKWPSWSPDGTKIIFLRDLGGNWEIYAMNVDGSGQTRLTNNNQADGSPAWSPDGTKITFSRDLSDSWEIFVMNADGSGQTRLTYNNFDDGHSSWSPDGTKIVFLSERDDNYEIYVMNVDGTGQTRLTNNNASDIVYGSAWQGLKKTATLTLEPSTTNTYVDVDFNLNATLSAPRSGKATLLWAINDTRFIYRSNLAITDGKFNTIFAASSPGIWAFKVVWEGDDEYNASESNNVTVRVQLPTISVRVDAGPTTVYSGGTSTIRASLTGGGAAISGASVTVSSSNGGSMSAVSDKGNGTYVTTFTAPETTAQTTCTLTFSASKAGYLSGSVQAQITVQPLVIKIQIKGSDGAPFAGVALASASQPSGQAALSGSTDVNGQVSFAGVLKGSYTFKASKSGYDDKTLSLMVQQGQAASETVTLNKSPGGIPGYPALSIIFAMLAVLLVLYRMKPVKSRPGL